jgi:hypothetical protein
MARKSGIINGQNFNISDPECISQFCNIWALKRGKLSAVAIIRPALTNDIHTGGVWAGKITDGMILAI